MRLSFKFSVTAIAVAVLLPAIPMTALANDNQDNDEPTIVLVHGAWAGPSSWESVVRRLRDDGFRTLTPTLGLLRCRAMWPSSTRCLTIPPVRRSWSDTRTAEL
jgi:pimeloyl-ACP methyl ester carboxylesterase